MELYLSSSFKGDRGTYYILAVKRWDLRIFLWNGPVVYRQLSTEISGAIAFWRFVCGTCSSYGGRQPQSYEHLFTSTVVSTSNSQIQSYEYPLTSDVVIFFPSMLVPIQIEPHCVSVPRCICPLLRIVLAKGKMIRSRHKPSPGFLLAVQLRYFSTARAPLRLSAASSVALLSVRFPDRRPSYRVVIMEGIYWVFNSFGCGNWLYLIGN